MPEYLAPGVYVEEVERGAKPIAGVSTSTAGFLGPTERGPTGPRLLTSFADFKRLYGGHLEESHMATGVEGFFANGGNRCYVGRIAAADEDTAEGLVDLEGEDVDDDLEALLGVDRTEIDFGEVAEDSPASETVTLSHEGDEDDDEFDVVLADNADLHTTMSSVDELFEFGWDDTVTFSLEPDDEGDLEITFEPRSGKWDHWARLRIDPGGDVAPVAVDLEGVNGDVDGGEALLDVDPAEIDFGEVAEDSPESQTVTLSHDGDTGDDDIDVVLADHAELLPTMDSDGGFTVEWDDDRSREETVTLSPTDEEDLEITFEPRSSERDHRARLRIGPGGDVAPVTVDLEGINGDADEGEALLAVDRTEIDFGEVAEDSPASETVTLSHEGNADNDDIDVVLADHAELLPTMDSDGGFTVEWDDTLEFTFEPDDEEDLEITFEPRSGEWKHWARLSIDPDGDIAPVTVDLEGVNEGESGDNLLIADPKLNFGAIGDDEVNGSFTVRNEAEDPLTIDPSESLFIGPAADDFELDEHTDITVDSGDEETLTVTFTSETDRVRPEATLLLPHSGNNSPLVVEVSGMLEHVVSMTAEAIGPGEWGGHVAIVVEDASMYDAERNDLFKLIVRYWGDDDDYAAARAGDADPDRDVVPEPDVEEVFDDLSPEAASSNYYVMQVNDSSVLIDLEKVTDGRPSTEIGPYWLDVADVATEIDTEDYKGNPNLPPEDRTGFAGFEKVDEISIVCVPDEHDHGVTGDLIKHCAKLDDRFAILQAPPSPGPTADLRPPEDTDMAAFYYPWLEVTDPNTGMIEEVPPGGHVAGIYARSDAQRGVHKAPANEVVRGIEGLQRTITKGEQEVLNPRGVNCIRSFRGRGIRVWGARTASSDPAWRYVNVRRLFLFLRESIEEGTQWVVFEPNDEQLWARVRQTISNFLTDVWDDGALMGTSPDEAFFVKCDRSTMTQNDIENGRLICEIGVAPVRPAEFVVFRISQWTASAE